MVEIDPPAAGTLLAGKYRVERELGSGGMGIVLEVTHLALDQRMALKLLNENLVRSPEVLARFLREARIAAKLPSEHIARVSDVGQTENGTPYLVMELLAGRDLQGEILRRGKLPVADAVDLILQACEGLADAHAAGLVHRDLKPANLFLARRPNRPPILKVLDFGLSKEPPGVDGKAITSTSSVFGTPQYMSPEQIKSTKNVDARSDQHALGMILYELITGVPPYQGETVTETLVAISTASPPHPRALCPEVPPALDDAIVQALAKRPNERFTDLAAFAAAIAPFGGALARDQEQNVKTALLAQATSAPPEVVPKPTVVPSDQKITVPAGLLVGRPAPMESLTDLTSSVDPTKRGHRTERIVLASMMVLLGAGVIALAFVQQGPLDEIAPTPGAVASIAPSLPPPSSAAATLELSPSPSASVAAPARSASAASKRAKP